MRSSEMCKKFVFHFAQNFFCRVHPARVRIKSKMPKMRAVEATSPKGPLKLVEREIPQPGPRQVRIKVQACGL